MSFARRRALRVSAFSAAIRVGNQVGLRARTCNSILHGTMEENNERKLSKTALKVGIFSAVALGAVVSGFLVSRQGRRFVRDVWEDRRRTQLEDRALNALWSDRKLGRRRIDVQEIEPGVVALIGRVRNPEER